MRSPQIALAAALTLAPAWAQTTITISTAAAQVHLGTSYQFAAKVTGTTNTSVAWSVALPAGASGTAGSISTAGRYTPPSSMPGINTVVVTVTSVATPTAAASATVTLLNPFPAVAGIQPPSAPPGAFTLTIDGSGFVPGAQALFGGAPLATAYVSATRLTATGTAAASQNGQQIPIAVTNPEPGSSTSTGVVTVLIGGAACPSPVVTSNAASRFLEQAAFGPDAATVAHVQCVGLNGYIGEQLTTPISPYPDPGTIGVSIAPVQARFFSNAVHGKDQLRQRVAFALSQIFVVSAIEESTPAQLVPYLQILQNDALANFRTLMEDVTLSPTMGEYLDMRNNDKANPAANTRANENYARELMQLFTIGLSQLKPDGTLLTDASGNPIPTYDQTTIQNFAKIYTGWTYPSQPGVILQKHNPAYYIGPMVPFESNHDTTSKTLLNGLAVPAGGTAASDLKAALDNIFAHPNVGPFVGRQLIQHLVTSNPTPDYVGRVAARFNNNGNGVRGDLGAVVTAILLDPEARALDAGPSPYSINTGGHLREPVLLISSILRGLGALVNDTNNLTGQATNLGQTLFAPPTVFNYFAPGYMIPAQFTPGLSLAGPEFQLHSPSAAVARYNMVNSIVFGSLGAGAVIDLTGFSNVGNNPAALATLVSNTFFGGLMPGPVNTELLQAMNAITGATNAAALARAQAAIYLAVTSSYYTVEH